MSKKIIIVFLLLSIALIMFLKIKASTPRASTPASILSSPTPTLPDQSILSFSPESLYLKSDQASEAAIQINSQGKYPTLIQLEIAYDPQVITQVVLSSGAFFPNAQVLLNSNDEETGRLSYALGLPSDEAKHLRSSRSKDSSGVADLSSEALAKLEWTPPRWPRQTGIVAKLKFTVSKTAAQTETQLYFLPKTQILSQGINIPTQITSSLKIYITSPTISASASSLPR